MNTQEIGLMLRREAYALEAKAHEMLSRVDLLREAADFLLTCKKDKEDNK